jgi:hypothetical protein
MLEISSDHSLSTPLRCTAVQMGIVTVIPCQPRGRMTWKKDQLRFCAGLAFLRHLNSHWLAVSNLRGALSQFCGRRLAQGVHSEPPARLNVDSRQVARLTYVSGLCGCFAALPLSRRPCTAKQACDDEHVGANKGMSECSAHQVKPRG